MVYRTTVSFVDASQNWLRIKRLVLLAGGTTQATSIRFWVTLGN